MSLFPHSKNHASRKIGKGRGGFSLIEAVIYIAILAMLTGIIVNTLLILSRSWNTIKIEENIAYASSDGLERMTREIRDAKSIDVSDSVFGTNPGVLVLNTTDASGSALTLKFFLINGVLSVQGNGAAAEPLFPSGVTATSLVFSHITDPQSEAVLIQMTLQSNSLGKSETRDFETTVSARDEYKN